jgi:ketosteroid isomerase-like protein
MGAAENKELIRNMFAELHKGNFDAYLDCMADDLRFTMIGTSRFSGTYTSKQEFVEKVIMPIGSQLDGGVDMQVENLIAEGDTVVMQASGKAGTTAGKRYDNVYCQVFTIANGKVQEVMEYLDTEVVTSAFGE